MLVIRKPVIVILLAFLIVCSCNVNRQVYQPFNKSGCNFLINVSDSLIENSSYTLSKYGIRGMRKTFKKSLSEKLKLRRGQVIITNKDSICKIFFNYRDFHQYRLKGVYLRQDYRNKSYVILYAEYEEKDD